jgi:hypothetical protein
MKRNHVFLLTGMVLLSIVCSAAWPVAGTAVDPHPLHGVLYLPGIDAGSMPKIAYTYPYPGPTPAPTPIPFEILKIWTMDIGSVLQDAFHPGDVLYLVVDYYSGRTEEALFNWTLATHECRRFGVANQLMFLKVGYGSSSSQMTVPVDACPGEYTLSLHVQAGGQTVEKQIVIQIMK